MNKYESVPVLLALFFALSSNLLASFEQDQGGARVQGMGGGFAGLADSVDAMYYNPGGLGYLKRPEVNMSYSKLYVGLDDNSNLSQNTLTGYYPLKGAQGKQIGGIGLGYETFSLNGLYSESSLGVYAGGIVNKIGIGMGLKFMSIGYGTDEYTALNPVFSGGTSKGNIGIDIGVITEVGKGMKAGISLKDLNTPDMGIKYEDKVKRQIIIGGSYSTEAYNVVTDLNMDSNGDVKLLAGGERYFMERRIAVRAGLGIGSRKYGRFNIGAGYEGENIIFDYVFYYPLSGISDTYGTHKMTFGYKFGESERAVKKQGEEYYKRALGLIKEGRYAAAKPQLEEALRREANNDNYRKLSVRLNEILEYAGNMTGKSKWEDAARIGINAYVLSEDVKELVKRVMYAYSINTDQKAMESLYKSMARKHSLTIDDSSAKTWDLTEQKVYQALEKFKAKKYDEVIKLCEEVLELDANNVIAYKRLGSTFYIMNDMPKARKNWQRAVELAPDDPDAKQILQLLEKMK
jgi:tetratricopeptide (TPR) repeat protein